jgi:hypothetical protein
MENRCLCNKKQLPSKHKNSTAATLTIPGIFDAFRLALKFYRYEDSRSSELG